MKILKLFLTMIMLSSCSLFKKEVDLGPVIYLETYPTDAFVYDSKGTALGQGKVRLNSDKIKEIEENGFISFYVKRVGHETAHYLLDPLEHSKIKLKLKKLDKKTFKKNYLNLFPMIFDDLVMASIDIQEDIFLKKPDDALEKVKNLKKKYPLVSSIYVLEAVVQINRKRNKKAKIAIKKALALNSKNKIAIEYKNYLMKK